MEGRREGWRAETWKDVKKGGTEEEDERKGGDILHMKAHI